MRTLLLFTLAISVLFCHAQQKAQPPDRFSPSLKKLENEKLKPDCITVVISFRDHRSVEQWKGRVRVLATYEPANVLVCRLKTDSLTLLASDASVEFADLQRQPKEELTTATLDLTPNR